jgi:hypothetical protein
MDDEVWHVDGTDYLARTVHEEADIGPIGFIHWKQESTMARKCKGKKGGKGKK